MTLQLSNVFQQKAVPIEVERKFPQNHGTFRGLEAIHDVLGIQCEAKLLALHVQLSRGTWQNMLIWAFFKGNFGFYVWVAYDHASII